MIGRLALLFALSGCLTPLSTLTRSTPISTSTATFELKSEPAAVSDTDRLHASLERAAPKLERWGNLVKPVTVKIAPTHDQLERAVGRVGYDWLRAWSTYRELIIQSPATWAGNDGDLDELVVHELTHCLLFQRSGTDTNWAAKEIPLWFREGMATVTADQGLRYPSLEDLADWLDQHAELDVFGDAETLSKDWYAQIYGLSFHAMRFFLKAHRDQAIVDAMALMIDGDDFEGAFTRAAGVTPSRFQSDFLNFLRFRAFRGFGLKLRHHRPPLPMPQQETPK